MDGFFIFAIILAVLTIIGVIVMVVSPKEVVSPGRYGRDDTTVPNEVHSYAFGVSLVLAFLTIASFALSTFVMIHPSTKGIEIVAGKQGATFNPGWHWKDPIATVKRYDGTVQTKKYDNGGKDAGDPFRVQLGNGGYAHVEVTYQWRLAKDISAIYNDYPKAQTSDLDQNVVYREVQQQLNIAYANFNPTATLSAQSAALTAQLNGQGTGGTSGYNAAKTYVDYGNTATSQLISILAPQGISFLTLTIGSFTPDATTQAQITKYQNGITDTQLAIQQKATATAIAAANKTITDNPPTHEQNIQTCLANVEKDPQAYAGIIGFNCGLGGSVTTPVPTIAVK